MREPIIGLTEAIRQVLREAHEPLPLRKIYEEIDRKISIAPEQREITYGRENWKHSVRRILTELVRNGEVIRTSRATYKWL